MTTAKQLRDAVRHLIVAHGAMAEATRPCGAPLSLTHAYALLELLDHAEAMTVSELAVHLSVDRTNVSRLCARMEEAGELVRVADPDDRRARRLRLTAHGKRLARSVDASSALHFAGVAEHLGEQAIGVIEALRLLQAAMNPTNSDDENPC